MAPSSVRTERAGVEVDVGDSGEGAVADTEPAVVAQAQDPVAGLEGEDADIEFGSGDRAVVGEVLGGRDG